MFVLLRANQCFYFLVRPCFGFDFFLHIGRHYGNCHSYTWILELLNVLSVISYHELSKKKKNTKKANIYTQIIPVFTYEACISASDWLLKIYFHRRSELIFDTRPCHYLGTCVNASFIIDVRDCSSSHKTVTGKGSSGSTGRLPGSVLSTPVCPRSVILTVCVCVIVIV